MKDQVSEYEIQEYLKLNSELREGRKLLNHPSMMAIVSPNAAGQTDVSPSCKCQCGTQCLSLSFSLYKKNSHILKT